MDLSERGKLSSIMLEAISTSDTRDEPIMLGTREGLIYVHDNTSTWNLGFSPKGEINAYTPQQFFARYGDPSMMVTLAEYRAELAGIPTARDERMHQAADIYNTAVDLGFAEGKIEYSGTLNYGRIENELNWKLREANVPEAAEDQINKLRGENSDLNHRESAMSARLKDVDADVAAQSLAFSELSASAPAPVLPTPR